MVVRRSFLNQRSNLGRTGEGNQVDVRMTAERGAGLLTQSWNHVDRAVRKTHLRRKLGQAQA